jgi:pyruvate/2-oxoglutarate dehydrogenase complex dihydrolipoamide acyltransferase (E2) component
MLPQLPLDVDFQLPRLADSLDESTVSRWLKKAGDRVRKGEPLVEIETDKVNAELESPVDGVLDEIVVPEGGAAAVGAVIARLSEREDA